MCAGGKEVDKVTKRNLIEKVIFKEKSKKNGRVRLENVLSIQNIKLKRAIIQLNLSNNLPRSY